MNDLRLFIGYNFDTKNGQPIGVIVGRGCGKISVEIKNCLDYPISQLVFQIVGGVTERSLGWPGDETETIRNPHFSAGIKIPAGGIVVIEIPFDVPRETSLARLWLVSFEHETAAIAV